ncbi:MAG: hypothetical protein PHW69_07230 [Elusimicrobiaceae bacterium]|nr:hypothetical protein [Elusimicrobiaceae bacterium]
MTAEKINALHPANKIRLAVYTTVFGALWGLAEMFLGSWLHAVQFPFRGAAMAGIGALVLCAERTYTPVRGATLYTGLVALLMKFASAGAFKLGPAAGILIETAIVEAALTAFGTRRKAVWLAVMLACLEGLPHFFVTSWLMYGSGIFNAYLKVIEGLQRFFGLPDSSWKLIAVLWIAGHFIIGAAYALVTVRVLEYLEKTGA